MTETHDSAAIFLGCVQVVAEHFPEVVDRLVAEHVADAHGRCAGCPSGSRSAPRWPCPLRALGEMARARLVHPPPSAAVSSRAR